MENKIFSPQHLLKLNNPLRLQITPPSFLMEKAKITHPRTMLDFGAGTALFSKAFIDLFPQLTVYACDISSEMIAWIKQEVIPTYPSIIPIKLADFHIPLHDNLIDFTLMMNVLHELDSVKETLTECLRILQPSGKLVLVDWKKEPSQQGPAMNIRIDVQEAEELLKSIGFSDVESFNDLSSHYLIIATK